YSLTNTDLMVEVESKAPKFEDEYEKDQADLEEEVAEPITKKESLKQIDLDAMFTEPITEEIRSFTKTDFQAKEPVKEETYKQEEYELRTEHHKDTRVNKLPVMYYVGQLHG